MLRVGIGSPIMRKHRKWWFAWYCCVAATAMAQADSIAGILGDLQDPNSSQVFIAAHRGGYEYDREDAAPENSIANIRNCASKVYELFETDIQRTKDGHFVIIHDPTIERETSGAGKASEMTLLELKSLKKRYRDGSLSSERVASLEEFLEEGRGLTVFKADMKPGVSQHFDEIMKLVVEGDALDGIIFRVPYKDADLYEAYRERGVLIAKHTLMFMVFSTKQVDDIKSRFDSSTIEIKLDKLDPTNEKALDLIRYAIDKGFVVEAHAEGDKEDWEELIGAGVRMFHAKAPSKVKKLLESRLDSK